MHTWRVLEDRCLKNVIIDSVSKWLELTITIVLLLHFIVHSVFVFKEKNHNKYCTMGLFPRYICTVKFSYCSTPVSKCSWLLSFSGFLPTVSSFLIAVYHSKSLGSVGCTALINLDLARKDWERFRNPAGRERRGSQSTQITRECV